MRSIGDSWRAFCSIGNAASVRWLAMGSWAAVCVSRSDEIRMMYLSDMLKPADFKALGASRTCAAGASWRLMIAFSYTRSLILWCALMQGLSAS